MDDLQPIARSPILAAAPIAVVAGWEVSTRRSSAALTITDQTPLAKVAVKADPDGEMAQTLGVPFGRVERRALETGESGPPMLVVGSGPGEWLILAPPGEQTRVRDQLRDDADRVDELVTVIDVTHGRALLRLTGAQATELLSKECRLELEDDVVPSGAALRTAVAGVATDLIRQDRDGDRSYLLHCEQSFGAYLYGSLLDAGAEFGAEADGFVPPGV